MNTPPLKAASVRHAVARPVISARKWAKATLETIAAGHPASQIDDLLPMWRSKQRQAET